MMKEQLIRFETAVLAKAKGFDVYVNFYYFPFKNLSALKEAKLKGTIDRLSDWNSRFNLKEDTINGLTAINCKYYSAPTQALLQKWLREKHQINVESNYLSNLQKYKCSYVPMEKSISNEEKYSLRGKYYGTVPHDTYEEALEEGLLKALTFIKPE